MNVSQQLRKIKINWGNSSRREEDEELRAVAPIDQRNSKIVAAMIGFRKDVGSLMRTGLKEENIDKRKKRLEEYNFAASLKDVSIDLGYLQANCLARVLTRMGGLFHFACEEELKNELIIERTVYDELQNLIDVEKTFQKAREKLEKMYIDVVAAQKTLEKENTPAHQEALDIVTMKLESLKDATIADILNFSTREQEIANIAVELCRQKLDYHRRMVAEFEKILPLSENDIKVSRPGPLFGTSLAQCLEEHHTDVSPVIEKCCALLRKIGFTEKGIFRVNGNSGRVRRIKAAFDAGHYDTEEKFYQFDPNSVSSVLKLYLRELPEPLLTNQQPEIWMDALNNETEDGRLAALKDCIDRLPAAHRDNLAHFMGFLYDLEQQKDVTAMNASNLAIVMAPNLLGPEFDGNNSVGTKIVELLITNTKTVFGKRSSPENTKKAVNTPQAFVKNQFSAISPRSSRPKDKAPPPPVVTVETGAEPLQSQDLDFEKSTTNEAQSTSDAEWSDEFPSTPPSKTNSLTRSYTERKPNRPPPPSFRSATDNPHGRPISYHMAVGATEKPTREDEFIKQNILKALSAPIAPARQRASIIGPSSPFNASVASISAGVGASNSSLNSTVIDVGNNRTMVNLDGEPSTSTPKPKPPLPVKPKELSEKETSRL